MTTITLRSVAGRPLSNNEVDTNFSNLNDYKVEQTGANGSALLPAGTTAQRPASPAAGYIRYNATTGKFEGYGSAWGNIGGGAFIGDTAPANPGSGDLWWNSATGHTFVFYGSAWVDLFGGAEGQYLPLTGGTVSGALSVTGNVGIGTSSPGYKLDVRGVIAGGNGTIAGGISYSSRVEIGAISNHNLGFITNNDTKMLLDTSGNLGLGVTPSAWVGNGNQRAIQISTIGSISSLSNATGNQQLNLARNAYDFYGPKYITSDTASALRLLGDNSFAFFQAPSGTAGNAISFTQAMTLDASGNLLVGTTSTNNFTSATIFSIKGLAVAWNDAQYIGMPYNAGTGYYNGLYLNAGTRETNIRAIADDGASKITFSTGITAVERARIDGSGNLFINTTSIVNSGKVSVKYDSTANAGMCLQQTNAIAGTMIAFYNSSNTLQGYINNNNNGTVSYIASSDQRLKENIVDAPGALSSVNAIKVRSFDWKADGSHTEYGYIAQELLEVVPEAVSVPADPEEMMGVDFGRLTPRLVKAIQELSAELNELKARIH